MTKYIRKKDGAIIEYFRRKDGTTYKTINGKRCIELSTLPKRIRLSKLKAIPIRYDVCPKCGKSGRLRLRYVVKLNSEIGAMHLQYHHNDTFGNYSHCCYLYAVKNKKERERYIDLIKSYKT